MYSMLSTKTQIFNTYFMLNISDLIFCDSDRIRTYDPQLRRLLLYPAELRNQSA